MRDLPVFEDPNLLVGAEHFADAGVYRLADDLAIVQSLDFFPPVVDDPETFGRVAAANALSDLYAVGATPRTAMNIVGFPDKELGMEVLGAILRGGAERVRAAGAVVLGGHSVRDAEVKYGLSVTGTVDPARMLSNAAARPGDVLVLTKALGTGFVTTALRGDACPAEVAEAAIASMVALNDVASRAAVELGARAATDITGFGLGGHALEMAEASAATIVFELAALPLLPGVAALAEAGHRSRANGSNAEHVEPRLERRGAAHPAEPFVFDPQTSGGLLVALEAGRAAELVARCRAGGATAATIVGRVEAAGEAALVLEG